jgi:hypothetical protein
MSDIKEYEWRGRVISTLESLNHNDDVIDKRVSKFENECDKKCGDLKRYQMLVEKRITSMEVKIDNLIEYNRYLMKVLIGAIIVTIGSFITVMFNSILV